MNEPAVHLFCLHRVFFFTIFIITVFLICDVLCRLPLWIFSLIFIVLSDSSELYPDLEKSY